MAGSRRSWTGRMLVDTGATKCVLFEETLAAAVRHAGASRISARISTCHGRLLLCLRDDGIGMSAERMATGIGLLGMQERARSLGGDLRIRSRPGRGTLVFSALPLRES